MKVLKGIFGFGDKAVETVKEIDLFFHQLDGLGAEVVQFIADAEKCAEDGKRIKLRIDSLKATLVAIKS